jgi:hypothetical protein
MAQDEAGEHEALDWADALIGDAVGIGSPPKNASIEPPGGHLGDSDSDQGPLAPTASALKPAPRTRR